MSDLTYVSSSDGDWCGIYIDNTLYTEGHSIRVYEWLDIVENHTISKTQSLEVDADWLIEGGSFPQSFADIPSEYLS